ncbi:hypothetical protein ACJZ2D_015397 [Fusarium nematophilum]
MEFLVQTVALSARSDTGSDGRASFSFETRDDGRDGSSFRTNNKEDGLRIHEGRTALDSVLRQALVENKDPGLPSDGGFWAWVSAVAGHLVRMNPCGYNSSFGLFQTYYTTHLDNSVSQISWIGSVQISVLFLVGPIACRLTDAGDFCATFALGTLLTCLGVFMTSLSTAFWYILLAQGICTGLSNGLLSTPGLAVVSSCFKRRRALAFGITPTGSASGGLIFPSMTRQLLAKAGFGWPVRAMGIVQLVTPCLANMLLRPRVLPKQPGSWVDWASSRDEVYVVFAVGIFSQTLMNEHMKTFLGLYFAYYYLASFTVSRLGTQFSYSDAINALLVVNGVGLAGRSAPSAVARKVGCSTVLTPAILIAAICFLAWPAVSTARRKLGLSVVSAETRSRQADLRLL